MALPKGIVSLSDLRSFEVVVPGADDFVRVIFNGHLVIVSEDVEEAVLPARGLESLKDDPVARTAIAALAVDRHTKVLGRKEIQAWGIRGWNHLIVELENFGGPCGTGIHLSVNGQPIEGVPTALPLPEIETRLTADRGPTPRAHAFDALCARVAYQFELR